jgi:hypothetical protein
MGQVIGLLSSSPFFSDCFFSSFCHQILEKRKDGDRERLRKISKQVSNIFQKLDLFTTTFRSLQILRF